MPGWWTYLYSQHLGGNGSGQSIVFRMLQTNQDYEMFYLKDKVHKKHLLNLISRFSR